MDKIKKNSNKLKRKLKRKRKRKMLENLKLIDVVINFLKDLNK